MKFYVQTEISVSMNVEIKADSLEEAITIARGIAATDYVKLRRSRDELINAELQSVDGAFEIG